VAAPTTPPVYTLTGTVTTPTCGNPYALLHTDVTIRNEVNTLIGDVTMDLPAGASEDDSPCRVVFRANVPRAQLYELAVGSLVVPSYSFEQLEAMRWHLDLAFN